MAKTKKQQEQFEKYIVPNRYKKGDEWKGNANGRPKGTGLTDRLRKLLEDNEGREADAIIKAAVEAAKNGDARFFNAIFDRLEGKVKDRLEVDGEMRVIQQRFTIAEKPSDGPDD